MAQSSTALDTPNRGQSPWNAKGHEEGGSTQLLGGSRTPSGGDPFPSPIRLATEVRDFQPFFSDVHIYGHVHRAPPRQAGPPKKRKGILHVPKAPRHTASLAVPSAPRCPRPSPGPLKVLHHRQPTTALASAPASAASSPAPDESDSAATSSVSDTFPDRSDEKSTSRTSPGVLNAKNGYVVLRKRMTTTCSRSSFVLFPWHRGSNFDMPRGQVARLDHTARRRVRHCPENCLHAEPALDFAHLSYLGTRSIRNRLTSMQIDVKRLETELEKFGATVQRPLRPARETKSYADTTATFVPQRNLVQDAKLGPLRSTGSRNGPDMRPPDREPIGLLHL